VDLTLNGDQSMLRESFAEFFERKATSQAVRTAAGARR
jgi:hypothetical protein